VKVIKLRGIIVTVLSKSPEKAREIAGSIAKLEDKNKVEIYYRKLSPDLLLSVLVPTDYPDSILNAVSTATLSDVIIFRGDEPLNSFDGELLLLMGTLEKKSIIIGGDERIKKLASSAGVKNALFVDSPHEIRFEDLAVDKNAGFIYIDRVFPVRGVGTVMLGYAKTSIRAHDKFVSLPAKKEIEIKSIQVLDVDFEEVGYGTRVGLAIKGEEYERLKETYSLVRGNLTEKIEGKIVKLPWSVDLKNGNEYHIYSEGCYSTGIVEVEGDGIRVQLRKPLPEAKEYLIATPNTNGKMSRIVGKITF
jgi:selenocysteine-specific translation elongation factor